MADGMREKTTNVGGVIKRIWYAMTGATQGAELASLDDAGKFKCVSEQITGLAGIGSRMVVADSTGNLSASTQVETGTWTPVLRGQGDGIAVAGASNSGRYTKIGKLVMFSADVDWTSITGTILGNRFIGGLPYASSNTGSHGSAYHGSFTGLNCSPNRTLILTVASGADIIYIGESDLQSGGEYLQAVTISSSGSIIGLSGWYYTD